MCLETRVYRSISEIPLAFHECSAIWIHHCHPGITSRTERERRGDAVGQKPREKFKTVCGPHGTVVLYENPMCIDMAGEDVVFWRTELFVQRPVGVKPGNPVPTLATYLRKVSANEDFVTRSERHSPDFPEPRCK